MKTQEQIKAGRQVWGGLRYRCPTCRPWSGIGSTNCACGGKQYLTEKEALAVYGCIAPALELPYCHICLNQNVDELFGYAVTSRPQTTTDQWVRLNSITAIEYNTRIIYRCRNWHGHEDPAWVFYDAFTGATVHLGRSQ
jgi:hypothetical protein